MGESDCSFHLASGFWTGTIQSPWQTFCTPLPPLTPPTAPAFSAMLDSASPLKAIWFIRLTMFSPQSPQCCSVKAIFFLISLLSVFKEVFLHFKNTFFSFVFKAGSHFLPGWNKTQMLKDSANVQTSSGFSNLAKWTLSEPPKRTKRSLEETVLKYADGLGANNNKS